MSKSINAPTDPSADLAELNQARLEDDLTYQELGEAIGVDGTALNRLLNLPNRTATDRTLFKIRRFLQQRAEGKRPAKRRVSA